MKRLVLLVFATFAIAGAYSQERYSIDGKNIVVSKIVEGIPGTADEIYGRAKNYFARAYGDSNSVIQTDDKAGGLIIGKGLYTNIASHSLGAWTLKAYHIIRVDIKNGRARIICSASTIIPNSSAYPGNDYEYSIIDYAPIVDKKAPGATKKAQSEAFNNLVERMSGSVESLGSALKEGGVLGTEKTDW